MIGYSVLLSSSVYGLSNKLSLSVLLRTCRLMASSSVSDLRIVLLGKNITENNRVGNFILGRAAFESEAPADVELNIEKHRGKLKDRDVTVINTPHLLRPNLSITQITQRVKECVNLSAPGPHVIILVLQENDFSDNNRHRVKYVLNEFSKEAPIHTLVLTDEREINSSCIHQLIKDCGGEHLQFDERKSGLHSEILERVEKILKENQVQFLISDLCEEAGEETSEDGEKRRSGGSVTAEEEGDFDHEDDGKIKQRNKEKKEVAAQRKTLFQSGCGSLPFERPDMSDLRIVLLGKNITENNRVGNFILGRAAFESEAPADVELNIEKHRGKLKDRDVTVINTPHLLQPNLSISQITQGVKECVNLSAPGPHVIILVLQENDFSDNDRHRVKYVLNEFSKEAPIHTLVLTDEEEIHNNAIHQFIQECGDEHLQFDERKSGLHSEILERVEKILKENQVQFLISDLYEEAGEETPEDGEKRRSGGSVTAEEEGDFDHEDDGKIKQRNKEKKEVAVQRKTLSMASSSDPPVLCDFCDERKQKAVKSCLTCQISYCDDHLEPHLRVPRLKKHTLIKAVENLEDYICQKHERPLEMFCRDDQTCVCLSCTEGEHRTHNTVPIEEDSREKKTLTSNDSFLTSSRTVHISNWMIIGLGVLLVAVLIIILPKQYTGCQSEQLKMKEQAEDLIKLKQEITELEMIKGQQKAAEKQAEDLIKQEQEITELKRRNTELEMMKEQAEDLIKLKQEITELKMMEEQQKEAQKQAEDLIKELQQEITELKRRNTELMMMEEQQKAAEKQNEDLIKQEQEITENLTSNDCFITSSRTVHIPNWMIIGLGVLLIILLKQYTMYSCLYRVSHTKGWTEISSDSGVKTLKIAVTELKKLLKEKLTQIELKFVQKFAVDVTLDPDTAYPYLILSDDGKQVRDGDIKKDVPENPKRFDTCAIVLAKQGFSSGRFYYEVQVKGKTKWDLGVARESINRKGKITLGSVNGYWTVWLRNENQYSALDNPLVSLSLRVKPEKVGVFVDYEEGLVSFYDVDSRSHIYSFTGQTFTDKLYPYFCPGLNDKGKNSKPLIITPVN
ncbi:uncharacterized protein LOC125260279 isoform X2 [Megalobrama amblycephala]|uniref:uncharacterized protein LOC125260279 isoform X2 n=1 Tax=Megalobrama amblycephala TaxID=75352 RepID=UPI002013C54C|nr:uncharacterized protein LOC125260279 isoform X2 [Megalobrama amblycephala]